MTALVLLRYECPVCLALELTVKPYATWPPPLGVEMTPPYCEWLGDASYDVCPNCGFEFGSDDDPGLGARPSSFEDYRAEWTARGSERFASARSRTYGEGRSRAPQPWHGTPPETPVL